MKLSNKDAPWRAVLTEGERKELRFIEEKMHDHRTEVSILARRRELIANRAMMRHRNNHKPADPNHWPGPKSDVDKAVEALKNLKKEVEKLP